jgi:hypothetical protein
MTLKFMLLKRSTISPKPWLMNGLMVDADAGAAAAAGAPASPSAVRGPRSMDGPPEESKGPTPGPNPQDINSSLDWEENGSSSPPRQSSLATSSSHRMVTQSMSGGIRDRYKEKTRRRAFGFSSIHFEPNPTVSVIQNPKSKSSLNPIQTQLKSSSIPFEPH